jgi:acetate kinase
MRLELGDRGDPSLEAPPDPDASSETRGRGFATGVGEPITEGKVAIWRQRSRDFSRELVLMNDEDDRTYGDLTGDRLAGGRKPRSCILTINGGSSSLKFAVIAAAEPLERILSGRVERVGLGGSRLVVSDPGGRRREDIAVEAPDQDAAAGLMVERVERNPGFAAIAAIGHRVVHGGDRFVEPGLVTAEMLDHLRRISPLDPEHLPGEVALIETIEKAFPGVPQVACFDTAFHHAMPRLARIIPIPRRYWDLGVRRYGFHGLSYAYLMEELEQAAGPVEARGRVVLAHLGSGASLAALREGRCLETTMGFTPASGLVMGTRCGDLDPGLVAFLARAEGMTPERFHRMVNHESGLLGVSETSADMRDLLARYEGDVRAAEAVDLFCYQVKKGIGALSAVLGGLDSLVFSGGIGENSPEVRRRVCEGLEFLGVALDVGRNVEGAPLISTGRSSTKVRVIRTDEESMIAREVIRLGAPSS